LLAANYPDFIEELHAAAEGVPVLAKMVEQMTDARRMAIQLFLGDILTLMEGAGIPSALPPKSDYGRAPAYLIYRLVRASIEVAFELARQHAPAALPELDRLRRIATATLVDRLYEVRRTIPGYFR
jgi:hypothetical protein